MRVSGLGVRMSLSPASACSREGEFSEESLVRK